MRQSSQPANSTKLFCDEKTHSLDQLKQISDNLENETVLHMTHLNITASEPKIPRTLRKMCPLGLLGSRLLHEMFKLSLRYITRIEVDIF